MKSKGENDPGIGGGDDATTVGGKSTVVTTATDSACDVCFLNAGSITGDLTKGKITESQVCTLHIVDHCVFVCAFSVSVFELVVCSF
jgi:hypothetical protein